MTEYVDIKSKKAQQYTTHFNSIFSALYFLFFSVGEVLLTADVD